MKWTWKQYLLYGSLIIVGLALILAGYGLNWTGFGDYAPPNGDFVRGKTLWDWMELLVIPLVLAIGAFFLQRSERAVERKAADDRAKLEHQVADNRAKLERELANDRQQEAALQAYLDRMAELLFKEILLASENEKVLNVARVRTLTVMRGLNATRNGIVLRFLHDIGLAGKQESDLFVDANLQGADLAHVDLGKTKLQGAYLEGANLEDANLHGANLRFAKLRRANLEDAGLELTNLENANLFGANLYGANLYGANLEDANLEYANLEDANLHGANLEGANLLSARVSNDQLAKAKSLQGATMPNGTIHD